MDNLDNVDNLEQDNNQENNEINALSMELLVNKTQYNKILFRLNPSKFKERQKYYNNIEKHKPSILNLFTTLLNCPSETITREINNSFDSFIMTCIKHLEISNIQDSQRGNDGNNGDKDVLFDSDNMFDGSELTRSLWGEEIKKSKYSYLDSNI